MADEKTPAGAAAAAAAATAAPAKKPRFSVLVIAIAAVVVVGAAGGGYYFFSGEKSVEDSVVDTKSHKNGKANSKLKVKAPAVYVKLDPPFVANFEAKGLMRFLQVSVEIMTRDAPTVELLKLHDPMIRNDLLMLLGNQTYETISTLEGKERLRDEALKIVAKVVASEGGDAKQIEKVYFTSFVMQ